MAEDSYARPSGVLENKLNLDRPDRLAEAEAGYTQSRIKELNERSPIQGNFDREHLKAIHGYIFQDIYPWSGRMRDEKFTIDGKDYDRIEISKGGTQFIPQAYIQNGLNEAFKPIQDRGTLASANDRVFANQAGRAMSDLNYVHPFREGNGRTQRAFIEQLGRETGHSVDLSIISRARMTEASIEATKDPASPALPDMIYDATNLGRAQSIRVTNEALRDAGADPDEFVVKVAEVGKRYEGTVLSHDERTAALITNGQIVTIDTADMKTLIPNSEVTVDVTRDVGRSYTPERDRERAREREQSASRDAGAER